MSVLVVAALEDNPLFNAGKGSVLTEAGTFELEAAVMDGATMRMGAVAGLTTVKNPIKLARLVLEQSPWSFLGFEGAEAFADQHPALIERVDGPSYFYDEVRFVQWRTGSAKAAEYVPPPPPPTLPASEGLPLGTVGCVALDRNGDLACSTSTGGRQHKSVGRIGDTPLIGAGSYSSHDVAVSCTGDGEEFIRRCAAHGVHLRMQLVPSMGLQQAVSDTLSEVGADRGGIIAVDRRGHVVGLFTTTGMYRGLATSAGGGKGSVGIWDELLDVDL